MQILAAMLGKLRDKSAKLKIVGVEALEVGRDIRNAFKFTASLKRSRREGVLGNPRSMRR